MPSLALIVSEVSAVIRIDNMARPTRLVILNKNIYILWGRKRFLLPVTYFPANLVYPFTLWVYILLIGIDLAMSVCPYERCDLGNNKSCNTGIRHADSRDSCAAQVCFVSLPRHKPPTNFNKSFIWTRISRKLWKIGNWDFRFWFRSLVRSASLLRECATPTNRPNPWRPQFSCQKQNFNWNVLDSSIAIDLS